MSSAPSVPYQWSIRVLAVLPFLYTPVALIRGDWSVIRGGFPFWVIVLAIALFSFTTHPLLRRLGAVVCIVYALAGALVLVLSLALDWLLWEVSGGDPRTLGGHPVSGPPPPRPGMTEVLHILFAFPVAAIGVYGSVRLMLQKSSRG